MRFKKKHTTLAASIFLIAAISLIMTIGHSKGKTFFEENAEAIAASEAYYLEDCMIMDFCGSMMVSNQFCNILTSDYLLFSCETSCHYPSERYNKCVRD